MSNTKYLTNKQHNFVINYIKNGFNGYRAALDAGYSESVASVKTNVMLANPMIREHIEKAYKQVENRTVATFEWKINKLLRVINHFIPDEGDITGDVRVGIQALSELNKMHGDYAPDKRLSITVDATKDKLKDVKRQYKDY